MARSEPTVGLDWCESHVIIKATLSDGTILRLGDATLYNVPEAGDVLLYGYEAKIVQDAQVKISTTRTADQATITAENVDKELGLTINNVNTVLLGAKVTCCKVFSEINNLPPVSKVWESKVLLIGEIAFVDVTEDEVTIKIVSDTAPNVAFIAAREVGNKCPLIFKGVACGYSGPLTTCNKLYQSDGGCSGRANQHRFGGVVETGELTSIIRGGLDTEIGVPGRLPLYQPYTDVGGGLGRNIVPFELGPIM
jgi:hypothetical protein